MNSFVSLKQNQVLSAFQLIQEVEALILPGYTEESAWNQKLVYKKTFYSKQIIKNLKSLTEFDQIQPYPNSPGYIDNYLKDHGSVMISPKLGFFIFKIQQVLTLNLFKKTVQESLSAYSQTIGRHYLNQMKRSIIQERGFREKESFNLLDDKDQKEVLESEKGGRNHSIQEEYTGSYLATYEAERFERFSNARMFLKQIEDQLQQKKVLEWLRSFKELSDLKKDSVFQFIEQIEKTILPDYTKEYEIENLNLPIITYLPKARQHLENLIKQEEKPDKPFLFYLRCLFYLQSYPLYISFPRSSSKKIKKLIRFFFKCQRLRSREQKAKPDLSSFCRLDLLRLRQFSYTFDWKVLKPNKREKEATKQFEFFKQKKASEEEILTSLKKTPLSQLHGLQLFTRLVIVTSEKRERIFREVKETLGFRIGCNYLKLIKEEIKNDKDIFFESQDPISNARLCIEKLENLLLQKQQKERAVQKKQSAGNKKTGVFLSSPRKKYKSKSIFYAQLYLKKVKEKLRQSEMKQEATQQIRRSLKSLKQNKEEKWKSLHLDLILPGYREKYLLLSKNVMKSPLLRSFISEIQQKIRSEPALIFFFKIIVFRSISDFVFFNDPHYFKQIKHNITLNLLPIFFNLLDRDQKEVELIPDSFLRLSFLLDDRDQKEVEDTFQFFQEVANLPEYTSFEAFNQKLVVKNFVILCSLLIVYSFEPLKQKRVKKASHKVKNSHQPKSINFLFKNHKNVNPSHFTSHLLSYQTWLLALDKNEFGSQAWLLAFEKLLQAERGFMEKTPSRLSLEPLVLALCEELEKEDEELINLLLLDPEYINQYFNKGFNQFKDVNPSIQQVLRSKEVQDFRVKAFPAFLQTIGRYYLKEMRRSIKLQLLQKEREQKGYSQKEINVGLEYFAFHKKYQSSDGEVIPHARNHIFHIKEKIKEKEKEQHKQFYSLKQKQVVEGFQLFEEVEALILPEYTEDSAWNQKLVVNHALKSCEKQIRKSLNDLKHPEGDIEELLYLILPGHNLANHENLNPLLHLRMFSKQIKQKLTQKEVELIIGGVKKALMLCFGRYFLETIKEHVKQNIKQKKVPESCNKKTSVFLSSVLDDLKQKKSRKGLVKKQPNLNTKNLYEKKFANYKNVLGYCCNYLKRIEEELKQKERDHLNQNPKTAYTDSSHQQFFANHENVIGHARYYLHKIKSQIKSFYLNQSRKNLQDDLKAFGLGFDHLEKIHKKVHGNHAKRKFYKKRKVFCIETQKKYSKPRVPNTRAPISLYSLQGVIFSILHRRLFDIKKGVKEKTLTLTNGQELTYLASFNDTGGTFQYYSNKVLKIFIQKLLQKLVKEEKLERKTLQVYVKPRVVKDQFPLLKQILHPKQSNNLKSSAKWSLQNEWKEERQKTQNQSFKSRVINLLSKQILSKSLLKQNLYNYYKNQAKKDQLNRIRNRKAIKTNDKRLAYNRIFGLELEIKDKVLSLISGNINNEWVLGMRNHSNSNKTDLVNQSLLYNTQPVPDWNLIMEKDSLKDQERLFKSLTDNNDQFAQIIAYIYKLISFTPSLSKKQDPNNKSLLPDHYRVDSITNKVYLKNNTIYLKYLIDCFFQTEKLVRPLLTSSYFVDPRSLPDPAPGPATKRFQVKKIRRFVRGIEKRRQELNNRDDRKEG